MRTLHIPELVITAEPKPSEVQYLEDRIDQFKSSATGITDGEWLGIFVRDNADFRWSRWWMTTRTVTKTCSCVSTLVRQPLQQDPHEWDASPIATVNLAQPLNEWTSAVKQLECLLAISNSAIRPGHGVCRLPRNNGRSGSSCKERTATTTN